ncbi:MAG: hypothetical protein IJQ39_11175 [Thermoguttaceae bacterium]|nr:hypothetical protein [Thermoguttaceae bacterium]
MKPTIRILLVLLLALGVCFSGISCDSPQKPKKRSSSKKKEEKKKTPPKPVVEEIPVVPVKPPLPQDLKTWGKKDFFRAREEGDDRLDEACALLGAPFENKPSAVGAVEILRSILTPLPIPEMPDIPKPVKTEDMTSQEFNRLELAYKKKIKEEEDKIKNIPKLNSRTIAAIIEILGQNGDDAAWKLLVDLVQRRQTVDDDTDIEKNVVQTILSHPRSNNLDLIFQMITQPSVFLKPVIPLNEERGKRRITSTQVRTMAIEWMKKYSDPEFRERVTDYLLAHPEDRELKTLAVPYLISGLVGNIRCMHKIYMSPNFLNQVDREKVERLFLNCSAAAFASITNQVSKSGKPTPDEVFKELSMSVFDQQLNDDSNVASNAENNADEATEETAQDNANPESYTENPATENEQPEKGTSWRIQPYVDTQINDAYKLMAFHPEYAIMILDVVWQNDFIARQKQSWEGKMEFKNREDPTARFLLALPLAGQRQYWDDFFTSAYQNGPLVIDKIPLMGYMPTDFGLILELKKIKRNVLPPSQQKKPTSSKNSRYNAAKQRQIELQGAWMEFVRLAVKIQMDRCANAAAVQKAKQINVDQLKARTPFTIPEGAHVLSEYHMILPNEYTKNLQGIQIDPVEIHYVQFQWDVPAMTIPSKVKYKEATAKMRFNTLRSSDMGSLWFEYTNPECTESFDIRIPVVGQSKEDLKEYPKGPVQVMSIRVRSN